MFNTIMQLLAGLTNVIGTTYAVLSILKLTPHDLYKSVTIEGMDKNDESLLTQKKQARVGITLIAYAWILQFIFSFVQITSCCLFLLCILGYLVCIILLCLVLIFLNKRFAKKYDDLKATLNKDKQNRHIDSHVWHDF